MTLLISLLAAIMATLVWYTKPSARELKAGLLCQFFWGASLMWLVDGIFEFAKLRADYFRPAGSDMLNDAFLGLSVIALGLLIWVAVILITDPRNIIKGAITNNCQRGTDHE